jgi:hypothetical protein
VTFSPNPYQTSFERSASKLKDVLMRLKPDIRQRRSPTNITSLQNKLGCGNDL